MEVRRLGIIPERHPVEFADPREPVPAEGEGAGRGVELGFRTALMPPPGPGQEEVLALRIVGENRPGQLRIGRGALAGHAGLRRQLPPKFARKPLHARSGKHRAGPGAFEQVPFRREIGREARMPFKVILGEIGPQRGVRVEMLQRLGLE